MPILNHAIEKIRLISYIILMKRRLIREFAKFYQPHKKLFALDMTASFMMSAIDMAFPVVSSWIIDEVVPAKNMNLLLTLCFLTVGAYMVKYLFEYIVVYYGHRLGLAIENSLRKKVFDHLQTFSFSYFDSQRTGRLISRLTTDIFDISEFSHHGPEDLFISVIILIGSFIIMILTNIPLTIVIFLIVPIMIAFAVLNNNKWEESHMQVKKQSAELTAGIEDTFGGIRVVKAFTNEAYQKERFDALCDRYAEAKKKTYRYMSNFISNTHFFTSILNLAVIFVGGYLIYLDRMTAGVLVEFLMFVNIFVQPVRRFTSLVEDFQKAKTGFRRCSEILGLEADIVDAPDAVEAETFDGDIKFEDVSFTYSDNLPLLEHFSLHIAKGENVAIVGPSGAGKTTLSALIPRFYDISQGRITIDGTDIRRFTQKSLRKNIGIVQQDVFLFNGTIRENIAYGKIGADDAEIEKAAEFANLHDFIMQLPDKYDTVVGERGVKLSGGQKQRVAISRIFLKNPPILILDEATSNMDNQNEKAIQSSFDRLAKNRTTLVIAHRLQTIENADRIIVLADGKISEEGTHKELLTLGGVYANLYRAQSEFDA